MIAKLSTGTFWFSLLISIYVATPSSAQAPDRRLASAEADYFNAVAKAKLDLARNIATGVIEYAEAQAPPPEVILRRWLDRQAIVQLLLGDPNAANKAYQAACQYPVKSDPSSLGIECLAGLALTDLLAQGASDIASQRAATAAAMSVSQNVHGLPFILAHMAASINLLDKDRARAAEAELDRANKELATIGVNTNPGLTIFIAILYNRIGDTYLNDDQPDNVKRVTVKAVELHASVVDHTNPDLFMTLFWAASNSRDPATVRRFVLWMYDIVAASSDINEAQTSFELMISVMHASFLKDTYVEVLWRWQSYLEKSYGARSTPAAQNLIKISDLMYAAGRDDDANLLRERGLAILATTSGVDSDVYRQAANSIQYKSYLAFRNLNAEIKKSFTQTEETTTHIETSAQQKVTLNPDIERKIKSGVNQAITSALAVGGTDGLEILLTAWGNVTAGIRFELTPGTSKPENDLRESEAVRLMDTAWSLALQVKAFNDHTFPQIVSRIARIRKKTEGLLSALAFLEQTSRMIDNTKPGYIAADAKLLSVYAELSPDEKTMESKFLALETLEPTDNSGRRSVVQAMMAFGSGFEKRQQNALAITAYQRAANLAKNPDLADDYDRDHIDRALARLSGMDAADIEFMQISKLRDDDPDKVQRFADAALQYQDIEHNRSQALRFIREAVRLQKQQLLTIVGSMPLSGSEELEERKGFFDDDLMLNLDLLLPDDPRRPTSDPEKLREAVELLQWRRNFLAGNSLLRSSVRAALPSDKKGEARAVETAIIQWGRVERELVASAAGGSTGALSGLAEQQSRLAAQVRQGVTALAGQAELFQGLSGIGKLTLEQIQHAILPGEALIVFAKGEVTGLYALALRHDGGALVDLERGPDGIADYNKLDELKIAFQSFQASFGLTKQAFNYHAAASLHEILFSPLEPYLTNVKRLTILPDVSFPSVAYPALVSTVPPTETPTQVSWLTNRFALSVALSLESFVAIREQPTVPVGAKFIGFADPVVRNNACAPVSLFDITANRRTSSGLCELPETLDHVYFLARGLGVDTTNSILAGAALTKEAVLVRLSQPAKIVVFATYGLMGDEMRKLTDIAEPALLLSPSGSKANQANRWLTMSDIELLTINADLIVLSACNTSADSQEGGEAFSGLARAFFEAGARSLAVTNWYIDPATTGEFLKILSPMLAGSARLDVPSALQRAMLAQMTQTPHPRDWAVFTLLGD